MRACFVCLPNTAIELFTLETLSYVNKILFHVAVNKTIPIWKFDFQDRMLRLIHSTVMNKSDTIESFHARFKSGVNL